MPHLMIKTKIADVMNIGITDLGSFKMETQN